MYTTPQTYVPQVGIYFFLSLHSLSSLSLFSLPLLSLSSLSSHLSPSSLSSRLLLLPYLQDSTDCGSQERPFCLCKAPCPTWCRHAGANLSGWTRVDRLRGLDEKWSSQDKQVPPGLHR